MPTRAHAAPLLLTVTLLGGFGAVWAMEGVIAQAHALEAARASERVAAVELDELLAARYADGVTPGEIHALDAQLEIMVARIAPVHVDTIAAAHRLVAIAGLAVISCMVGCGAAFARRGLRRDDHERVPTAWLVRSRANSAAS